MQRTVVQPAELWDGKSRGYSHAVKISDTSALIFVSGHAGLDENLEVVSGDFEVQARRTFETLTLTLQEGGATWSDVVKMTIYLVDEADQEVARAVRKEYVDPESPPASTMVTIRAFNLPSLRIEVDLIAAVG